MKYKVSYNILKTERLPEVAEDGPTDSFVL
jgi:hypothetical protein